jgi:hypothetical protein
MHRQAAFFSNFMDPDEIDVLDTFKFPSVDPTYEDAVMGGARYASALTDSKEVRKFMRFLMSNKFGTQIAAGDDRTWLLPNLRFDHRHYADPLSVEWAELTNTAQVGDLFRLDASDHMGLDQNVFWQGIRNLVSHDATVPEVLATIDAAWDEEPEQEVWLDVLLPEGNLDGSGFPPLTDGFEYLFGADPSDESNWYTWEGSSGDENVNMPGVVAGATVGDWVGIRHVDGQEAILQIIDFTFDFWDGDIASGTIDPTVTGVVMVCWWDTGDPDDINGCEEEEEAFSGGTWQVDGLGASPDVYGPYAYLQAYDFGGVQVIPYPFP